MTCTKPEHASKEVQRAEVQDLSKPSRLKYSTCFLNYHWFGCFFFFNPSPKENFGERKTQAKHTWATQQEE